MPEPLDEAVGYAELVGRWLRTFGPGTTDDLVWWLGPTKSAVRRALVDVSAQQVTLDDGSTGWVLPGDEEVDALARVAANTMWRLVEGITPAAAALFRLAQADADSVTAEDYRRDVYAVLDDAHDGISAVADALARLNSVAPAGSWAERDSQDSPQLGRLRATVERILELGNPYFLDV